MANICLKPGRKKSIKQFHPWIFPGANTRIEGKPGAGEEVRILSAGGEFLARGF